MAKTINSLQKTKKDAYENIKLHTKEYFKIGCKMLENSVKEFDRSSLDFIQNEVYQNDNSNDEQLRIAALNINQKKIKKWNHY